MAERQVQVGETAHTIRPFTGYKAVRAGRIIARITQQYPDVLSKMESFREDYERRNHTTVTREMAKLPAFSRVKRVERDGETVTEQVPIYTEEDFDRAEGGVIEVPRSPGGAEQALAAFPLVFDVAEHELRNLIGLILISNRELEEADEGDRVDDALAAKGREALHTSSLEQLLELVAVAFEVVEEQFEGKLERLQGAISGLIGQAPSLEAAEESPSPSPEQGSEEATSEGKTEPKAESSESERSSSTDSPPPTGGAGETPSTEPVGASSPSSETG